MKRIIILAALIIAAQVTAIVDNCTSCDTDTTCYLLGQYDASGARDVETFVNYYGVQDDSYYRITLDTGEVVIHADVGYVIKVWADELGNEVIDFPCCPGDLDYSGWCGSLAQIEQYEAMDIHAPLPQWECK